VGYWESVAEGRSAPGAPVTALPWGKDLVLFITDPNGGIYTTFSSDHPPGRHLRKIISLDLLQRKFDEFLNKRERPPFLVRLNGTDYGASTVTVTFDDPVKGYDHDPFVNVELAKPGDPPTATGLPRSSGLSRCSTDA